MNPTLQTEETADVEPVNFAEWDFSESRKIHRQEAERTSLLLTSKDIKLLNPCVNPIPYSSPFTGVRHKDERNRNRLNDLLSRLVKETGATKQETLYASSINLGVLLNNMEEGHTFSLNIAETANAAPVNVQPGIKYSATVAVIEKAEDSSAVAIPHRFTSMDTGYLLPAGAKFKVVKIERQTWQCTPVLSCPRIHRNIKVVTLIPVS